jgi:hypothetical protein
MPIKETLSLPLTEDKRENKRGTGHVGAAAGKWEGAERRTYSATFNAGANLPCAALSANDSGTYTHFHLVFRFTCPQNRDGPSMLLLTSR